VLDRPANEIKNYRKGTWGHLELDKLGFFSLLIRARSELFRGNETLLVLFFGSLVSGETLNFARKRVFWVEVFNSFWGGVKVKYFNIEVALHMDGTHF